MRISKGIVSAVLRGKDVDMMPSYHRSRATGCWTTRGSPPSALYSIRSSLRPPDQGCLNVAWTLWKPSRASCDILVGTPFGNVRAISDVFTNY